MASAVRYVGQGLVYGAIALLLGYLSSEPTYHHFPADEAMVILSFAHGAQRREACRRLTPEEIAKLPPNMRRPTECPRERVPIAVSLELDGKPIYQDVLPPSGLAGDGPSRVYEKFPVPAGAHRVIAKLRDSTRSEGYDYERGEDIHLAPGQRFVIDFHGDTGGFIFK